MRIGTPVGSKRAVDLLVVLAVVAIQREFGAVPVLFHEAALLAEQKRVWVRGWAVTL